MNLLINTVLAQIIFTDGKEKIWLEEIIHPFVNKRINDELEKYKSNSVTFFNHVH